MDSLELQIPGQMARVISSEIERSGFVLVQSKIIKRSGFKKLGQVKQILWHVLRTLFSCNLNLNRRTNTTCKWRSYRISR